MGDGVYEGDNDCDNLWGCFKFVLTYGVRQGGGVAEVMKLTIGSRWLINETYFLVMAVMMLNIIFGIIIDTFGSLRAQKNELIEDTVGVCFICGIDNQVFDRASAEPEGFQTHIKSDHNMWNYLYFIFMLWEQDKDDDDGLEQYVRRAIDGSEITWFPLNKAIRLDQAATEEELTLREIANEIDAFEQALAYKIQHFQSDMSSVLETISHATRMEHKKGNAKDEIAQFMRNSALNPASAEEFGDVISDIATVNSTAIDSGDEEDDLPLEHAGDYGHSEDEEEEGLEAHPEGGSDEDHSDDEKGHTRHHHHRNKGAGAGAEGYAHKPKATLDKAESTVGFGTTDDSAAVFPDPSERLDVNSVMAGSSVLIKERSAAFWDMEGVSVPGTASEDRSRVASASDFGLHRPTTAPLVVVEESDEFHAAAAAAMMADPDVSATEKAEPPLEEQENVLVLDREDPPPEQQPPQAQTFEEGVNAHAVEDELTIIMEEMPESEPSYGPDSDFVSELTVDGFSSAMASPMRPGYARTASPVEEDDEVTVQEFGVPVDLTSVNSAPPASVAESFQEFGEPVDLTSVASAAPAESVGDSSQEYGIPVDLTSVPPAETVDEMVHEEPSVAATDIDNNEAGVEEEEEEEEEFVPDVQVDPSLDYLAGDSFRVTHVVEEDSQVLEEQSQADHDSLDGVVSPPSTAEQVEMPTEGLSHEEVNETDVAEEVAAEAVPLVDEVEMDSEEVPATARESMETANAHEEDETFLENDVAPAIAVSSEAAPSWTDVAPAPITSTLTAAAAVAAAEDEEHASAKQDQEHKQVLSEAEEDELNAADPSESAHDNIEFEVGEDDEEEEDN